MVINFICRASKADKSGQSSLEVSIIINGVRRYVHLDRKVKAADFNTKTQKVKRDASTNEYLVALRTTTLNLRHKEAQTQELGAEIKIRDEGVNRFPTLFIELDKWKKMQTIINSKQADQGTYVNFIGDKCYIFCFSQIHPSYGCRLKDIYANRHTATNDRKIYQYNYSELL